MTNQKKIEPTFEGVMPVRSEISVIPSEPPERLRLNWLVYETIGEAGFMHPCGMYYIHGKKHVPKKYMEKMMERGDIGPHDLIELTWEKERLLTDEDIEEWKKERMNNGQETKV